MPGKEAASNPTEPVSYDVVDSMVRGARLVEEGVVQFYQMADPEQTMGIKITPDNVGDALLGLELAFGEEFPDLFANPAEGS